MGRMRFGGYYDQYTASSKGSLGDRADSATRLRWHVIVHRTAPTRRSSLRETNDPLAMYRPKLHDHAEPRRRYGLACHAGIAKRLRWGKTDWNQVREARCWRCSKMEQAVGFDSTPPGLRKANPRLKQRECRAAFVPLSFKELRLCERARPGASPGRWNATKRNT